MVDGQPGLEATIKVRYVTVVYLITSLCIISGALHGCVVKTLACYARGRKFDPPCGK